MEVILQQTKKSEPDTATCILLNNSLKIQTIKLTKGTGGEKVSGSKEDRKGLTTISKILIVIVAGLVIVIVIDIRGFWK